MEQGGLSDRLLRRGLMVWTIIGVAILLVAALWLLTRISAVFAPFVLAMLLVFVLRRPVAALEAKGLSRGKAVAVCYLIGIIVISLFGVFVIPSLVEQGRDFISAFPGYYESASRLWFRLQAQYTDMQVPPWVKDAVFAAQESISRQLAAWSASLATAVLGVGGRLATFIIMLFLALALAFFVLKDMPVFKDELLRLGGVRRREDLVAVLRRITDVVEGWLRGQSIIAVIVGTLTWLGLQILGVPYAAIIGIIAGVTNFVPYVGPLVAGLIAAISAAFVSPILVLYTVLWIFVLQQLESLVLSPRIMSDTVNIHPVLIIFSLLVGAQVAGFAGMLFAVPVAGVLNALFVYYFEKHTDSQLATEQGALFRRTDSSPADNSSCDSEATEEVSTPDGTDNEERT
ncbi:MAG: AI-2E family transporter [Actinobacteria bacterium]|nr:AI-2E family transporter [Actinomycetota bacterium]